MSKTQSQTIREKVAAGLKDSGEAVAQGVADELVEQELTRRKGIISKALVKLDEYEKEMKKIKPDANIYNEDESVAQEGWSKGALENKKKLTSKTAKLEKAIDEALTNSNYKGLEDIVK